MLDWSNEVAALGKEKQKTYLKYALHMFRQSLLKNYTQNQLTRTSKEEDEFLSKFSKFILTIDDTTFLLSTNVSFASLTKRPEQLYKL